MASAKQGASQFLGRKRIPAAREPRSPQGRGSTGKVIVSAAALAGLGALVRRLRPKMQNIDWAKKLEAMPDNAPPNWMFHNITAIRQNTDRILEILESDRSKAQEASLSSGS